MTTQALTIRQEITPDTWNMLMGIGSAIKASRVFGSATAEEAAIKLLFCYENGLPLTTAGNGLFVVNGKIGAQANIIAAQLRRHPDYDYEIVEITPQSATVAILRRGADGTLAEVGRGTFTLAEAKQAGLLSKDNWRNYPEDMLFARAMTRAYRRYAPDVFGQPIYTPEELGDVVDAPSWTVSAPITEPTPQSILSDLVAQYGAEAVMAANGGAIPETAGDIKSVQATLNASDA